MKQAFKVYDFTLPANGSQLIYAIGEYFRVQSALGTLDITVEGYGTLPSVSAGQGLRDTPYQKLLLKDTSGAINSGTILCSGAEFIDNRTFGVNDLSATTIAQLRGLRPTASYSQNTAAAAGVQVLVAPGANVNGLWVTEAMLQCFSSVASTGVSLLAKTGAAPAGTADGAVLLFHGSTTIAYIPPVTLPAPAFVAAGMGLYTYNAIADSAAAAPIRAARWLLL